MTTQPVRRPPIGPKFYQPSLFGTAGMLAYGAALYLIPALLLRAVVLEMENPLLAVVASVPLLVLAGYGIFILGIAGHEGTHLSLARNNFASFALGLFAAAPIVSYFEFGFAAQHWQHHRHTNKAEDMDPKLLSGLKSPWQRVLFTRLVFHPLYFKYTLQAALGRPLPFSYKLPFSRRELQALALLNFAFSAAFLALYVAIAIYDPAVAILVIALPLTATFLIASVQPYMEHAGLGDALFHDTRSRTSPLMTALYYGENFHLEHHLYPGVPCWRLPKVHRLLRENGTYARARPSLDRSFLGAFRHVRDAYGSTERHDAFDPFQAAVTESGESKAVPRVVGDREHAGHPVTRTVAGR